MGDGGGGGGHAEVVAKTEEPRHLVTLTGSQGLVETGGGAVPVCQLAGNISNISINTFTTSTQQNLPPVIGLR